MLMGRFILSNDRVFPDVIVYQEVQETAVLRWSYGAMESMSASEQQQTYPSPNLTTINW